MSMTREQLLAYRDTAETGTGETLTKESGIRAIIGRKYRQFHMSPITFDCDPSTIKTGVRFGLNNISAQPISVTWVHQRPSGDPLFCAAMAVTGTGSLWFEFFYQDNGSSVPSFSIYPIPSSGPPSPSYTGPLFRVTGSGFYAYKINLQRADPKDGKKGMQDLLNRLYTLDFSDQAAFTFDRNPSQIAVNRDFGLSNLGTQTIPVNWVHQRPSGDPLFCAAIVVTGTGSLWFEFFYQDNGSSVPSFSIYPIPSSGPPSPSYTGPLFRVTGSGFYAYKINLQRADPKDGKKGMQDLLNRLYTLDFSDQAAFTFDRNPSQIAVNRDFGLSNLGTQTIPVNWVLESERNQLIGQPIFSLFVALSGFRGYGQWVQFFYKTAGSGPSFLALPADGPLRGAPAFVTAKAEGGGGIFSVRDWML